MAGPFEAFGRLFSRGGIAGGRGSFAVMACDCTASNVGTAGVGVFDSKVGLNLGFRTLNPLSSRITIVLDGPNKKIDIDVPSNAFETFGAVAAHVAALDPHPQYLTQAEADALY